MKLPLICDSHTFIQIPLLEPKRQKLSIGLFETKIRDQVDEVILVGVVWVSLLSCNSEIVIWIYIFLPSDYYLYHWKLQLLSTKSIWNVLKNR